MKAKYATIIRSLLQNYHQQIESINTDQSAIHSDALQLMELNIKLAKCLEGISSSAHFNNDITDYEELHTITLMVFSGQVPEESSVPGLISLAANSVARKRNTSSNSRHVS
ncbi:Uncharacterised protein [Cedecea davisae]|nr:hypothetical protein [Cedecea davisae]SUX38057.1 Uncharacterised protein [Cedecea davisae]